MNRMNFEMKQKSIDRPKRELSEYAKKYVLQQDYLK